MASCPTAHSHLFRSLSVKKFNILKKRFRRKKNTQANGSAKINKTYLFDFGLAIILVLVITLMFPRGKSFQFADLSEGRVYTGPEIIAPFTFAVNKSENEYARDVTEAKNSVPPVFIRHDTIAVNQLKKIRRFFADLEQVMNKSKGSEESLSAFFRDYNIVMSDDDIAFLLARSFSASAQNSSKTQTTARIRRASDASYRDTISATVVKIAEEIFSAGILDRDKADLPQQTKVISVLHNSQEMIEEITYYNGPEDIKHVILEKLRSDGNADDHEVKIAYQIIEAFITPTIFFDQEATQSRMETIIANVPLAKDQVLEGERIIDSHERIHRQHIDKLKSLAQAKAERGERLSGLARITPYIGKFLLVLLAISIIGIFLYYDRRQTLKNRKEILLIGLIVLVIAFFTFLVNRFALSGFLIPVVIGSMLLTIFFDSRLGFVGTVALGILVGGMRGNEFGIAATAIFVGSVAVLTVTRVRSRNWLIRSIAYIVATYLISVTVLDFLRYSPFSDLLVDWGYSTINGFLSPIFTYGLIVVIEYFFDITTDMTLLELSDLNQPLLRQLAMRAPGTYHHSIVVGNVAEAAAEAISANSLLARVGAYYHDIGKMEKAEYFVENQQKGRNPQEKLNPSMSTLILINHVRKGIELAREHGLPKEIEAFISEHHGTCLISYFFQKALDNSENGDVSETDFHYPGPRPLTRETAIVMLADSVEATSRALKDPSVSRIKGMVNKIVNERFRSGELDNCPLTLRDLNKISEAFQKILFGIFHGRIEYPEIEEAEEQKQVTEENKNNRTSD